MAIELTEYEKMTWEVKRLREELNAKIALITEVDTMIGDKWNVTQDDWNELVNKHYGDDDARDSDDLTYCPDCGLNPNHHQPEEQQKWESDYVKEHGLCHYCVNVGTGDE